MLDPREENTVKNAYSMLSRIVDAMADFDGNLFEEIDGDELIDILHEMEAVFEGVVEVPMGSEDDADPGDMDGDAVSALASAGFGTDEDYE
jgi:hypothetical protein